MADRGSVKLLYEHGFLLKIYANNLLIRTQALTNGAAFRLPLVPVAEFWQLGLSTIDEVRDVSKAETMRELGNEQSRVKIMANNLRLSNEAVNAEADALSVLLDNGYLRIYDGTQAATADTAIGAQVLLAELRINTDAAPVAVAGVLTFNVIPPRCQCPTTQAQRHGLGR